MRCRFSRWKLNRPYPSGALIAPTQYQHVGDLTTFAQNAATFACCDGRRELSTTRTCRDCSGASESTYSMSHCGKTKSSDGSLSALMTEATS